MQNPLFSWLHVNRSIRRKFLVFTVGPIALLFALFLPLSLQELERATATQIHADRTTLVTLNSSDINRTFTHLADVAELNAAFMETAPQLDEESIYTLLRQTLELSPHVFGATIAFAPFAYQDDMRLFSPFAYRESGDIVTMNIGSQSDGRGYDYTDGNWEWWSGSVNARRAVWTQPYFDEGAGNIRMISHTVPFRRDGEIVGVATIDVALDSIFEVLGEMPAGFDAIIDMQGRWIYNPRRTSDSGGFRDMTDQFDLETIEELLVRVDQRESGRIRAQRHTIPDSPDALITDRVIWWYFAPIPTTEWSYLYFQSENAVLAAARAQWRALGMLFALVVVLVIVIIWFISGRLTRPIIELHGAAEKVSHGDYEISIKSKSPDELGNLTRVFNRMAASMKTRNEDLEREVQTRTEALESTKKQIELQNKELKIAKDAAEAAAEAKASFLASMSHEIRTPMNGVLGMVELMRYTPLNDEQRHMIATIHDSGQALLTIINDILDLSKIEAGKLRLEWVPFSMQELVEGTAETLIRPALDKQLRLVPYVDPAIPANLIGDPARLRQILVNLIGNAVKFSETGEISVVAQLVSASKATRPAIRLSVQDQGMGISPDVQKQLFQPFTQAESSTTRRFGGTGLGLSICQRLASMMGSVIKVESAPGQGSEFSVVLEFDIGDQAAEAQSHDNFSDVHVMVLSASPTERRACSAYLGYWGARVTVFENEAELQVALREDNAHIVVLGSTLSPDAQSSCIRQLVELPGASQTKFCLLQSGRRVKPRLQNEKAILVDASPLRRVNLLTTVSIALGRQSPEVQHDTAIHAENYVVPDLEEAMATNSLILVAEDNPTNRDVIERQLRALGYCCELVEDGELALEAWHSGRYALLLTDCHMPHRDGFGLTAAIRAKEQGSDRRFPIIAITANALEGEAERCLAAGMDDYMSKPIEMKTLAEKLQTWMPHYRPREHSSAESERKDPADPSDKSAAQPTTLDTSILREMFGDDEETIHEILLAFLEPSRAIVEEIKQGVQAHSTELVAQAAHKLKSSARSIGAVELADLCVQFESAGKSGDLAPVVNKLDRLEMLMSQIYDDITKLEGQ
ncbi:ATP-binding protein [Pseudohongiella sp. O18]|uniref:sensor histidine kinase n=1 Tax=Pseudohongiella sp. O18 TaxID=2904248 RepID=UPI001F2437C2|nr:ATP-binding protein [Pseudohongiella sp. O18]